jgi:hypothetical protein
MRLVKIKRFDASSYFRPRGRPYSNVYTHVCNQYKDIRTIISENSLRDIQYEIDNEFIKAYEICDYTN